MGGVRVGEEFLNTELVARNLLELASREDVCNTRKGILFKKKIT